MTNTPITPTEEIRDALSNHENLCEDQGKVYRLEEAWVIEDEGLITDDERYSGGIYRKVKKVMVLVPEEKV